MRWIGYLTLGLVITAPSASAFDRSSAGTLAREAVPARAGRLAEPAKDASPPKPGAKSPSGRYRKDSRDIEEDKRTRSPVIVFGRGRR